MIRAATVASLLTLLAAPAHAQREKEHPLSTYVDSAALHAALAAAPSAAGRSLYWIAYDSAGVLKEVRPLTCREPAPGLHDGLAGLLRTHARSVHETRKGTAIFVWLRSGPSARVEVARSIREDAPELVNERAVRDTMTRVARRLQQQNPALRGRLADVTVEFRLDEEGVPGQSRILTPLGIPPIEDAFHAIVRSMRFRPGMFNRCPVPVLVTFPLILEFRH